MLKRLIVMSAGLTWALPALADVAPGGNCDCSVGAGAPTLAGALIVGAMLYGAQRRAG